MYDRKNPNRGRNIFFTVIMGILLIVFLVVAAAYISYLAVRNAYNPAMTVPVAAEAPATAYSDPNQIPYAQAETCESLAPGETRILPPGQAIMGDVYFMANGKKLPNFKNDIGDYDIIVNNGTDNVTVIAADGWGAGCLVESNVKILVNGEAANPNHTDFKSATVFNFTTADDYTVKTYPKDQLPLP